MAQVLTVRLRDFLAPNAADIFHRFFRLLAGINDMANENLGEIAQVRSVHFGRVRGGAIQAPGAALAVRFVLFFGHIPQTD